MSKIVYLCAKHGVNLPFSGKDMERVLSRLAPDNIVPAAPRIIQDQGILIGIFNPVDSLPVKGSSVCLGAFFDRLEEWWRPGSKIPDGSYALFRCDIQILELATDIVASRTIWYAQTEDLFIAATSQRAIVCFLQSCQFNDAVIPWVLSSGTLGPGFSWDRRIDCLGGDSRLRLDRQSWKVEVIRNPVVYASLQLPAKEHEQRLLAAMEETFDYIDPRANQWVLPLSGGYDSRAILLMIKNRSGLKTLTWGLRSALDNRQSDAWVARELANRVGAQHQYFQTDSTNEPMSDVFRRFLLAGEGRIDHISGYMDGFAIWKWLYEQGWQGVLRGDEAFGCRPVTTEQQVYRNMNLVVLSDYADMPGKNLGFEMGDQQRPGSLEQKTHESRDQWRDRVNTEFEIPFMFAALSDLKLAYVEIIQPLLSRRIVEQVRSLPDDLRTGKSLFKKIIEGMRPNVKFAKYPAIEPLTDILRAKPVIDTICGKLETVVDKPGPAGQLASFSLAKLKNCETTRETLPRSRIYEKVVRRLGRLWGRSDNLPRISDPYRLAFRVYTIAAMGDILSSDAAELSN